MNPIKPKNKLAKNVFVSQTQNGSNWCLQIDGDLGAETIPVTLVGIDENDAVTGVGGSGNQALLDDNGDALIITATTPNPIEFYGPARIQLECPITTNDVGIIMLGGEV